MNETQGEDMFLLIGLTVMAAFVIVTVWLAQFISSFKKELRYINEEIKRTSGAERRFWMRQRRRLWLSLIPFVKY